MADFPTLSIDTPMSMDQGSLKSGDLVHKDDAGYQITRRRYTRVPKTFALAYSLLKEADYLLLIDFIDLVSTVAIFNWTHPTTGVVYQVRFKMKPVLKKVKLHWSTTCDLVEV